MTKIMIEEMPYDSEERMSLAYIEMEDEHEYKLNQAIAYAELEEAIEEHIRNIEKQIYMFGKEMGLCRFTTSIKNVEDRLIKEMEAYYEADAV